MTHPLDAATSVELAVIERSGFPESRHLGAAVLVDADGQVLRTLGDANALIYPRSTLKLAQASAVEALGVSFDETARVLSTASHAGTPAHLAVVERMLGEVGLDASALRCPPDWPGDAEARRASTGPTRIAMNCSGKHAAFLTACVAHGWELESYLDPQHPLQQQVLRTVEALSGESIQHLGVDGCGAPLPTLSLTGLARIGSRAARSGTALGDAIRAQPWAIDGPGRANTVTIESTGLVAKLGAEGVLLLVTPAGEAVAVKALDGSHRATTHTGLELLVQEGVLPREKAEAALARIGTPGLRLGF